MNSIKITILFLVSLIVLHINPLQVHDAASDYNADIPTVSSDEDEETEDATEVETSVFNGGIIDIPYKFPGKVEYQKYSEVKQRIFQFDNVTIIGKDDSGKFNMYTIELGDPNKPTIFVMASMHGSEWQSTMYSMHFMEQLRDGTFPDTELRDQLLNDYHIVYIPIVNPWGYAKAKPNSLIAGRYNYSGAELNRDFDSFSQAESQNVKAVMDEFQPFAFIDLHMMQSTMEGNYGNSIVFGNGQPETNSVRNMIAESLSVYADQPVTPWEGAENLIPGLARTYMRNQPNPHTPYTLSYIMELAKPVKRDGWIDAPLTNREIMKYGTAGLYLFFKTSVMYYEEENGVSI